MPLGLADSATYQKWGKELYVDRLTTPYDVVRAAPELCALILRAYSHAYEENGHDEMKGQLPKGTVATRFGSGQHDRYRIGAAKHFDGGSEFWVIRTEDGNGDIAAFAKVTPGEVLEDPRPGTVYLNDVVVDPRFQRQGYGRTAVHAALKFSGLPDVPVWLEAFEASETRLVESPQISENHPVESHVDPGPNQLYKNMGLVRTGGADPFEFPDADAELYMCEYGTPANFTLNGVIAAMEKRYADLRSAVPRF